MSFHSTFDWEPQKLLWVCKKRIYDTAVCVSALWPVVRPVVGGHQFPLECAEWKA